MSSDSSTNRYHPHACLNTPNKSSSSSESMKRQNSDLQPLVAGVKMIKFEGRHVPIFTQLVNGPCPLLAIANTLILQGRLNPTLAPEQDMIELDTIVLMITNLIINKKPPDDPDMIMNYQKNVDDALSILENIKHGIDVNVRFDDIKSFEFTKEISLMDVLGLDLYHGWLMNPKADPIFYREFSSLSYNQLVDRMCSWADHPPSSTEYNMHLKLKEFVQSTSTQLTRRGLEVLIDSLSPTTIGVFFRNDHFSTVIKRGRNLLTLVTDYGYQSSLDLVWEVVTLHGSGPLLTSTYKLYSSSESTSTETFDINHDINETKDSNAPEPPKLDLDDAYNNFMRQYGNIQPNDSSTSPDSCTIL